ncbi:MAG: hypothetical protein QXF25_00005, partial [Candidatus Pacearchaeota archaeon]
AVVIRKTKRKRKEIEKDNLVAVIDLIADELRRKYKLEDKEIVSLVNEELRRKYNLTKEQTLEIIKQENNIPIEIFSTELGSLEAICKYMKENLNMPYSEIAKALNRDDRTIWTAYNQAIKKQKQSFEIKESELLLPISVFKSELTILESLILYLKEKKLMRFSEIARLLNRNQKNIWTIYSRVTKKMKS